MSDETVYIVDQVTSKPGAGRAFLDAYMQRYAPGAKERGMTLEHTWVAPPVWLEDGSNTLFFVWSVKGVSAGLGLSGGVRARTSAAEDWWWKEAAEMIATPRAVFPQQPFGHSEPDQCLS